MIASVKEGFSRLGYCVRVHHFSCRLSSTNFVPDHDEVQAKDIVRLEEFLINKPNILVVTGAGISTESGGPIADAVRTIN